MNVIVNLDTSVKYALKNSVTCTSSRIIVNRRRVTKFIYLFKLWLWLLNVSNEIVFIPNSHVECANKCWNLCLKGFNTDTWQLNCHCHKKLKAFPHLNYLQKEKRYKIMDTFLRHVVWANVPFKAINCISWNIKIKIFSHPIRN